MADFDLTMVRAPQGGVWSALHRGVRSALHRGVGSALHRGGRERAPQGGGVRPVFLQHLFCYSLGLDPHGSVHFRAPALAWASRRDRARSVKGPIAKIINGQKRPHRAPRNCSKNWMYRFQEVSWSQRRQRCLHRHQRCLSGAQITSKKKSGVLAKKMGQRGCAPQCVQGGVLP